MLKLIREIKALEGSEYDAQRDKKRIRNVYEFIREHCLEKEEFTEKSEHMMEQLKAKTLSEAEMKEWLDYASSIFASFLAVHMLSENNTVGIEETEEVVEYFRTGNFYKQVSATGLYACAKLLTVREPMTCYHLINEAFRTYPDLGYILGMEYRYEGKATEEQITNKCPICGGEEVSPYYCSMQSTTPNRASIYPPSKLWMKCNQCNNYYTYNFPLTSIDKINGHYTEKNGTILKNRFQLDIYNDIFTKLKELTNGEDYLEIGIGNGEMLAVAQEFGYHTEAVEICREDCERISSALDINIACCDIVDYETDREYDVIIMGDVFEHVTDPMKVMRKVSEMLKEDGVLWLSTPNYNCAYARMQKFTHCMWHELNHYTYVSYEAMKELLSQLDMEPVHYGLSKRYMGSMELFIQKKQSKDRK